MQEEGKNNKEERDREGGEKVREVGEKKRCLAESTRKKEKERNPQVPFFLLYASFFVNGGARNLHTLL